MSTMSVSSMHLPSRVSMCLMLAGIAGGYVSPIQAGTNVGLVDYVYALSEANTHKCVKLGDDQASKYKHPGMPGVAGSAVQRGDIFQVDLKKVQVAEFKDWGSTKSEVAIVARVFEESATRQAASGGFDFAPGAVEGGRVIYYSDDVRENQALNFGLLPIIGPVEYEGNPVGISLFVVEVDSAKEKAKINMLLSSLAGLGKSIAVPHAPGFALLEKLGTSLIGSNKDDLYFRYDTTFKSPEGARNDVDTAFLRYGDYVLIRKEDRASPIDWNTLSYLPSRAMVYHGDSCDKQKPYAGSYGVMQVNSARAVAYYQPQSFGALRAAIDKYEQGDVAAINTATQALQSELGGVATYKKISETLLTVEQFIQKKESPKAITLDMLNEQLKLLSTNIEQHNSQKNPALTRSQVDGLLNRLVGMTGDITVASRMIISTKSGFRYSWHARF